MQCGETLSSKCPNGHNQMWKCCQKAPLSCVKCDQEEKDRKKKQKKAFEEQQRRELAQKSHAKLMEQLDEELEKVKQNLREAKLDQDRKRALDQKKKDLAEAKQQLIASATAITAGERSSQARENRSPAEPELKAASQGVVPKANPRRRSVDTAEQATQQPPKESPSNIEWQRQKDMENASNKAIDDIMAMTGLEAVKAQVLKIKAKLDTCIRQNSDLQGERFGVVLLGNPGTGETIMIYY